MTRIPIPRYVNCPCCGAQNPSAGDRCASCGRPLTLYIGPPENFPRRLELRSLMALVAVVAVCLGVTHEVPVLGTFLLLIAVPALLRTFVWVNRLNADGVPMVWPEKLGAFAASVGVVWLIVLGAGAAFGFSFAVATFAAAAIQAVVHGGPANGAALSYAGVPVGGVGGVLAGYYLAKTLWPIRD